MTGVQTCALPIWNILRFQPPLVITEEQLDKAFAIIDQAFAELAAGKLSLPSNAEELGWE